MADIGRIIRAERKEQGLRQIDLAEIVGVSSSYISSIERGIVDPRLSLLKKISHELCFEIRVFKHVSKIGMSIYDGRKVTTFVAKHVLK